MKTRLLKMFEEMPLNPLTAFVFWFFGLCVILPVAAVFSVFNPPEKVPKREPKSAAQVGEELGKESREFADGFSKGWFSK